MKSIAEQPVINGLGNSPGLQQHSYSRRSANGTLRDCPELGENHLYLFTIAYSELMESIADTLFPPNTINDGAGNPHLLKASDARIDRHVHFRAAWQPAFGVRVQLALRDLTEACLNRFGHHFAVAKGDQQLELLTLLQKGALPPSQWKTLRPQADAFGAIYEAVSCGLLAEPGYGGNSEGIGWFYTRFMNITE